MDKKVYVDVRAFFDKEGMIVPLSLRWEDGCEYDIDRVMDVCPAMSAKAGGGGMRYTICIGQTRTFLFKEEDRWFVERR